jgi:uncharacterized membrane protein
MYCRNCGKDAANATENCPTCGIKMGSGSGYCPNCGNQTSPNDAVCAKCGAKLSAGTVTGTASIGKAPAPGVRSPYNHAWKMLWPNFGWLLLVLIIYLAISGAGGIFGSIPTAGGFISALISVFVGMPLSIGFNYTYLKAARKEKYEVADVFTGFKMYWNAVGASVLTALIVIAGFILVIVPGIVFSCKLAYVPFLVADRKMGPVEAIKESWRISRGHAMQVFGIEIIGILLAIGGAICLGVGIIIAYMWTALAIASLYYAVTAEEAAKRAEPVTPPAT